MPPIPFGLDNKSEFISRKEILRIVLVMVKHWYLLITFPVLALVGAYMYTHRIPDIYASKCQILLKSNEAYDYQQQIYRGLGFNSKYASYEETASQMRIIKSSNLLEEVMAELPLNVSYFIVGRLKVSEVYHHMPFMVEIDERSSLPSGAECQLTILDEQNFELTYEHGGTVHTAKYQFDKLITVDGLFIRVNKQKNLNSLSIKSLRQINYAFKVYNTSSLISKYKSNIEVKNIDYTSIIEVTIKDEIDDRAVDVLSALSNIYVQNTVRNKLEINENTLNYIDRQLEEAIRLINEIEVELQDFREDKSILNLTKEEETYYNKVVEFESEKRTIDLQLEAIDDLTQYLLQNENVTSLLPPSIFVNSDDPKLIEQVSALYDLRSDYLNAFESATDDNPYIRSLGDKVETLKGDILQYLDTRRSALEARGRDVSSEIEYFSSRVKGIPKAMRQILNIERRLAVNEELYSFLLAKRAETIIARAGLIPETKIIERPRTAGIVYPDKPRIIVISGLIAIAVSILLIISKHYFYQKITSIGQLQLETTVSVLGGIPKVKDFKSTFRILSSADKGNIAQAFRILRTNLQYYSTGETSKVVLVTSLLPSEGKTFTSVNLASILAIAEKRVLIIDFDLHKPRLANALEIKNEAGVSNYLIGQGNLDQLVKNTEIDTLKVLTSGPIPPNASELVLRKELKQIIEYGRQNFDYVVLDTPPISLITDGVLLMRETDVNLFVLNSKTTTKTSIDYIENLIESNSVNNAALVLNEEIVSRLDYYYSRYGYGGYGGYGSYGGYGTYGNQ